MAGGLTHKQQNNSKKYKKNTGVNSEIISNLFGSEPKNTKKSFNGVLELNKSINLGDSRQQQEQDKKELAQKNAEFIKQFFHSFQKEQEILYSQKEQEIKKELQELQEEIKKLIKTTENVQKDVENAIETNVVEYTEYQVNFFTKLKTFIINLRKNIEEADIWFESCNNKKRKKNCFWNTSQKGKNQQYMQSGEHTASRSAN
jgi:hypothetical protein